MLSPWRLFLLIRLSYHVVTASLCLGGSDIFASIRENSLMGQYVANLSIKAEPGTTGVRLCLTGENAQWFFLDGQIIRLNTSSSRTLDREVQGSVLMAYLTCFEEDVIQSQFRIIVEIVGENDNRPEFFKETIQPVYISELTVVNSVVFTVKASDADGDAITYVIDKLSPDAVYFRMDVPNSGHVVLDRLLDYENQTRLQLVLYAVEANTTERYNTTADILINVEDGDDQHPHFVPCTATTASPLICTNPVYSTNITDQDQNRVLEFSPGPIHAEDGDRGLATPLTYTIISGGDGGQFVIDNQTGEIILTRRVARRRLMSSFRLSIMASQINDPMKYSVAMALVRVLSENRFPPLFNRTTYKGFIVQSSSPATIVSTYGNQVLLIQATDRDFTDGVNPQMRYFLHPLSVTEQLYHISQEGVIIAKTNRLQPFDRHILQVVARDDESGEEASASVDIEVLQRGQPT